MRFSGVIFLGLGLALHWQANVLSGPIRILHWAGLAFVLAGVSYVFRTPRLLGKTADGKIKVLSKLLFFPYLFLTWATWHGVRLLHRETAFDQLTSTIWIGRRLLGSEPPPPVQIVLDLTCEFEEPKAIRCNCKRYISLPILDKGIPMDSDSVLSIVRELAVPRTSVYVHCAQGHGRTGMIATLVLLARHTDLSVAEALASVRRARPGVALAREQLDFVKSAAILLKAST